MLRVKEPSTLKTAALRSAALLKSAGPSQRLPEAHLECRRDFDLLRHKVCWGCHLRSCRYQRLRWEPACSDRSQSLAASARVRVWSHLLWRVDVPWISALELWALKSQWAFAVRTAWELLAPQLAQLGLFLASASNWRIPEALFVSATVVNALDVLATKFEVPAQVVPCQVMLSDSANGQLVGRMVANVRLLEHSRRLRPGSSPV